MLAQCKSLTRPSAMELTFRWGISLITWWILVCCVSQIPHTFGTFNITKEDRLLLKDEENPKCFTRTLHDFTCFFETPDNGTYDLFYRVSGTKRCELFVQATEEGTFLHVCSFPAVDVLLYVEMQLEVVERSTDTHLYSRTVCVEDHLLLDPPYNVSMDHNGEPGQLQVSWKCDAPKFFEDDMMFMIRYTSTSLGQKIQEAKDGGILGSVVPGEVTEVQLRAKCASNPAAGPWSRWSKPVRAMVPQSSGDISLMCFTSDLHNITCMWNTTRYGPDNDFTLFYKTSPGDGSSWSDWAECLTEESLTDLCRFQGHQSSRFRVKLCSDPSPLSRTFYTPTFTMYQSIRTTPPSHLNRWWRRNKLCLKWDAPLPILFAHLQYEVCYQIRETNAWMIVSVEGPETSTCVKLPLGSHYSAKIRAKPTGNIYSGDWSDWSEVVTGDTPANKSTFLLLCIPISMLMITVIAVALFPKYLSKLKLYFWPPVPNLDKVLQGYLVEMNGQGWNLPVTAKPCLEEIAPSFLEIMSDEEVLGSDKPERSTQLLPAEQKLPHPGPPDEPPDGEEYPGYVMLRKGTLIHCPKANMYIHNSTCESERPNVTNKSVQTCTDGSDCALLCSGNDFINQSYFPQAESAHGFKCRITAIRQSSNLYTNLPRSSKSPI
ncbi:thrombopoietin receptor isoform X2 [Takifugu flavidus]|uniref:thrombopoietin receptor isoform X2 n=1 Tax=Takifugu flavidus TaxID=433684 RepID=UPI00254491C2|nr:thrombopoietin receptor isoform X2 [Takifugu flavidus]